MAIKYQNNYEPKHLKGIEYYSGSGLVAGGKKLLLFIQYSLILDFVFLFVLEHTL